jgi:hypothetical protein
MASCAVMENIYKIKMNLYCAIFQNHFRGCHGLDRIVVGFTTTSAISAYHQL